MNKRIVVGAGLSVFVFGCEMFLYEPKDPAPLLLIVRDDPAAFSPDSHPLADVPAGTVMDDLANLEGCWASSRAEPLQSDVAQGVPAQPFQRIEVLEVHAGLTSLTRHTLLVPTDVLPFGTRWPIYISHEEEVEINGKDRMRNTTVSANAGELHDDGEVRPSFIGSLGASRAEGGGTVVSLLTLDGDSLRTLDGGCCDGRPEDLSEEWVERNTTLWFRVECMP